MGAMGLQRHKAPCVQGPVAVKTKPGGRIDSTLGLGNDSLLLINYCLYKKTHKYPFFDFLKSRQLYFKQIDFFFQQAHLMNRLWTLTLTCINVDGHLFFWWPRKGIAARIHL